MLVLTRRRKQAIWIEDVRVVITSIENGRVRIGIEADPSVKIVREEIMNKEEDDDCTTQTIRSLS